MASVRRIIMNPERAIGRGAGPDGARSERPSGSTPLLIPQHGRMQRLAGAGGGGRSVRSIAERWAVEHLARGRIVHWVDGACRIDPSRFLTPLAACGVRPREGLMRLMVSRGFTLHQSVAQIARLPQEMARTGSKVVILDGMLVMHLDPQVSSRESRALLRRSLSVLERLSGEGVQLLVTTEDRASTPHHAHLLQLVRGATPKSSSLQRPPRFGFPLQHRMAWSRSIASACSRSVASSNPEIQAEIQ